MSTSRRLLGVGALALVATLVGCGPVPAARPPASAPAMTSAPPPPAGSPLASAPTAVVAPAVVQFSLLARAAPEWNTWVALNQGFFSAEGIDAQAQVMG